MAEEPALMVSAPTARATDFCERIHEIYLSLHSELLFFNMKKKTHMYIIRSSIIIPRYLLCYGHRSIEPIFHAVHVQKHKYWRMQDLLANGNNSLSWTYCHFKDRGYRLFKLFFHSDVHILIYPIWSRRLSKSGTGISGIFIMAAAPTFCISNTNSAESIYGSVVFFLLNRKSEESSFFDWFRNR